MRAMFSHLVVFWTNPAYRGAADELRAGANRLLKDIPGVMQFHAGKMVPSPRPAMDAYQVHPQHVEFVEKYVKRLVIKVVVCDFE